MAAKSGDQVETDIYNLLAPRIKEQISGKVYKSNLRPKSSTLEDAVIIFTGGLDGQIQRGVVTVNIYVPDIQTGSGALEKDTARCRDLANIMISIIDETETSEYELTRNDMIRTYEHEEINQHFINTKITFRRIIN